MLFTLYYVTNSWIRSWKLNGLRTFILEILKDKKSAVFYEEKIALAMEFRGGKTSDHIQMRGVTSDYCENKKNAIVVDFLQSANNKRACALLPTQRVNLSDWLEMPQSDNYLPEFPFAPFDREIRFGKATGVFFLLEAHFHLFNENDNFTQLQLADYGIPKCWTAGDYFAMVFESDVEHFSKLCQLFMSDRLVLANIMEVIRLETVEVEDEPWKLIMWDDDDDVASTIDALQYENENEDDVDTLRSWIQQVKVIRDAAFGASHVNKNVDCLMCTPQRYKSFRYYATLKKVEMADYRRKQSLANRRHLTTAYSNGDIYRNRRPSRGLPQSGSVDESAHRTTILEELTGTGTGAGTADVSSSSIAATQGSTPCSISITSQASVELDTVLERTPEVEYPRINEDDTVDSDMVDSVSKWKTESINSLLASDLATIPESFTRKTSPVRHSGEQKTGKPPNVIVFSESATTVENMKRALSSTLHRHRYTIYSLNLNEMLIAPWMDQASLVVVGGNVPPPLRGMLLTYLLRNGGRMMCMCSDLLGLFLPTFKTAEVRPDEVVTVSYSRWKDTPLRHHIFCYQPSPMCSRFSQDDSPTDPDAATICKPKPPAVEIMDDRNEKHSLNVQVLAAESTWRTPTFVVATDTRSGGVVLFSQVHLEIDPHESIKAGDESSVRLKILSDLLSNHLQLDCSSSHTAPERLPAYFLGKHEDKLDFLKKMKPQMMGENLLQLKDLVLHFCGKGEKPNQGSARILPVMIHECPPRFSTVDYFEELETKELGRLVIYSDVMSSSMEFLGGPALKHGFVVIPRQQTKGIGRGGNTWLSPEGCAMFSIQLHIPLDTPLGQRLSLLQHIIGLSVVDAIRNNHPGCADLEVGLKWPNDIYAGGNAKIGGLVITTSIVNGIAICNVGCGLNLDNSLPTTCINDMIKEGGLGEPISFETYLAWTFNSLEYILDIAQEGSIDVVFDLYYKYWLHQFTKVTIQKADSSFQQVTIVGLDDHGFLKVRGDDGICFSVHPDGNTFNMLSGLIAPKAN